jgi:predicted DNA-binding protein (MmcQ/YjbR family)
VDTHGSDDRDLSRIRTICLRFPEAEEAELQGRSLFRVRTRRFALFNGNDAPPRKRWTGFGRSLHFVTDPQEREALAHDPRFLTSPHHGNRGWMALDLERDGVDWDEVAELLETAFRQVARRQLVEELDRNRDPDLS